MNGRYALAVIAALGFAAAIVAVFLDNQAPAAGEPPVSPATSPYANYVAGAGLVEASTGNIAIGTPVDGVVKTLDVHVGDFVEEGDPLFHVDDRDVRAQLVTAKARVAAAEAALQLPRHQLSYSTELVKRDPGAVSGNVLRDLRDQVAIAESNLDLAEAQESQLRTEIERYVIRAPVAGRVLQLDLRAGEYVGAGTTPLVLFGDDRTLLVRVDFDEADAWRIASGAAATAFVRGNPALRIPLAYAYAEPHIIPKVSLTGRSAERTDTRVLQVLFSFRPGEFPVYVGQQLDVFVETAGSGSPGGSPAE